MVNKLLAGGPVDDEIAPGDDGAVERHGAEKQSGEDHPQRAGNRDRKYGKIALLLHGKDTFLFPVIAIISAK